MIAGQVYGRPTFPVGIVTFVVRDGKLLLGKRKNVHGDGFWGLPGGHLEHRESMETAAKRELLEETGLAAASVTFSILTNHGERPDDNHYIHVGFLAGGVTGDVVNKEPDRCSGWEWFSLEALPKELYSSHSFIIKAFKEGKVFVDQPRT